MTSWRDGESPDAVVDVVIVGAGIVGLAHAVHALAAGASVMVVERDSAAVGASVRNFGHVCTTAQAGVALGYALEARHDWIRLAKEAGFWLAQAGTVVVARTDAEYAVLEDFAAARGEMVELLDAAGVRSRVPVAADVVGGALLPLDLRVDPRDAVHSLASWLTGQGVRMRWSTAVLGIEDGVVRTTRGSIRAGRVVVAVGHDVDRLYPAVAEQTGLTRCSLHMLSVANPSGGVVEPAVLTGYSMLRYPGFAVSPALEQVRAEHQRDDPRSIDAVLNLMFTQRPGGDLIIGDTHAYARTVSPFSDEADDQMVLDRAKTLLGVDELVVRERWQGVYASAPGPYLVATPSAGVRVVSVTSGIGMTTAFGLAREVVPDLLA